MLAGAGADKVLTTNASGIASWQTAGGGWDGILPNYTTAQRNALSLADGLIVYNTTDKTVQICVSGVWTNIGGKLSLGILCNLDGDCDSTHCIDGVCCDTACSGTVCQTCGALSSAGIGHCGHVNNSSNDPRSTCTTVSPPATDSCKSPNCSGTGYTCGYLSGETSQPTCKRCSGTSYNPVDIAIGLQDTEGGNLCTADHYRCNGAGSCTNPQQNVCLCGTPVKGTAEAECAYRGYVGCHFGHNLSWGNCLHGGVGCGEPINTYVGYCRYCYNWTY